MCALAAGTFEQIVLFCGLPLSGVHSCHHSFQWHVQTNEQPAFSLIAMQLGECKNKKCSPKGGSWPTGPPPWVRHCVYIETATGKHVIAIFFSSVRAMHFPHAQTASTWTFTFVDPERLF